MKKSRDYFLVWQPQIIPIILPKPNSLVAVFPTTTYGSTSTSLPASTHLWMNSVETTGMPYFWAMRLLWESWAFFALSTTKYVV